MQLLQKRILSRPAFAIQPSASQQSGSLFHEHCHPKPFLVGRDVNWRHQLRPSTTDTLNDFLNSVTLLYPEVIRKPLAMASQVAHMNGKKNQGEKDNPYYNLKTAITKKTRQMQRDRKSLNINKWPQSSFNPALTNRSKQTREATLSP